MRLLLPHRRALTVSALAVALPLASAAPAGAHGSFLSATPAPGERLLDAPARITLRFSEPLNPRLSGARLLPARGGAELRSAQRVRGGQLELIPRASLARGAYRVTWRSVSTRDGHPLQGSYGFGVRTAAPREASLQASPLATGGWVRAPVRWALYVCLLFFAGGLLAQALLGGRGRSWLTPPPERRQAVPGIDPAAVALRGRRLVADAGWLALGLAAAVAAVEAFSAAGTLAPRALPDFLLTGPTGPARLGVIAFIASGLGLGRGHPRAAALSAAAALACVSASGHASSAQPRTAALAADFAHLLGAAVWLGAGAVLVAAWWPALRGAGAAARTEVARSVLPFFGAIALPAFVIVVVTGTVNAALELGRPSALWQTGYGLVLAVKVALVAAIAAAAWWHSARLRPRLLAANPHPPSASDRTHWRLLRLEPVLGVGVAAAAAMLVAFPLPPRQLAEASRQASAIPACSPCPLPLPAPDELAVAELAGTQVVAARMGRVAGALSGEIRLLDRHGRPSPGRVAVAGARTRPCGRGCASFALAPAPAALRVTATEGGRAHAVTLPARWADGWAPAARRLLERAQRTMRGLASVRELERVTSGPGTAAVTHYRLSAPDRLAFATGRGVQAIRMGRRQWLRLPGQPWRRRDELGGGLPFSARSWFSWTPYAQAVQWRGARREGGREVVELALMDPGTPVWTRLWIERRSGRVLRERLVSRARLVTRSFVGFDSPVRIVAPVEASG